MKTMKDWNASHSDFHHFANPGDEVDEAIVRYFLGVVPPATHAPNYVQCGEAYDFDAMGRKTYTTFAKDKDGRWIYLGDVRKPDCAADMEPCILSK